MSNKNVEQDITEVFSKLKYQYSNYPGFNSFIDSASEVLDMKPSSLRGFISYISDRNNLTDFTIPTLKKLAAHLNNITYTNLDMENYPSYFMGVMNVARLRAIIRKIESNPNRI